VDADRFEDDRAGAALGTGAVIGKMLRARQMMLAEIRGVRWDEDAVSEGQAADLERAERTREAGMPGGNRRRGHWLDPCFVNRRVSDADPVDQSCYIFYTPAVLKAR
jgi:hypothetical protein